MARAACAAHFLSTGGMVDVDWRSAAIATPPSSETMTESDDDDQRRGNFWQR